MRGKYSAIFSMIVVSAVVACSGDPEAAKRQYMAAGDRAFSEKQYGEASVQYRKAVQVDPRFGEARAKLADAYGAAGNYAAALGEIVRAADLMPESPVTQIRAGRALLLAGQYAEARARALAALEKEPKNAEALMLLGNALANLKDLDGAIEQVEQAIDENPMFTSRYANLGGLQLAKGDRDAAEASFKRAVEVAPESPAPHLSLGNFKWAVGQKSEAENEFKVALRLDPKSALANRALAVLYAEDNKPEQAEPYFKAYADVSGTVDARLILADFYVVTRRVAEARASLTELAKETTGFVPATLRLAMLEFQGQSRPDAYRRLDAILKDDPKNVAARQVKTRFLLAEGKNQDALALAKALVGDNDKSATAHFLYGVALEGTGALGEATGEYQSVLQLVPSAVPAQVRLAKLYLGQGNARGALELTQQAVKAQPASGDVRFAYAQALLKSGNPEGAERELLALAKGSPSSAEVRTWLGMTYETKGDRTRARAAYQEALSLQPESATAFAGLVGADLNDRKPEAALARIDAQLAKNPNDPAVLSLQGMVHFAVRDWPRAEASYRKVLEIDPGQMDAYNKLGTIYVVEKRLEDARKTFEQLAARQQRPVGAETMLGLILTQQGNHDDARKHFERALEIDPRAVVAANNLAWDYASNGGNLDLALQLAQTAKAQQPDSPQVNDTLGWVYYKKGLTGPAVTAFSEAVRQSPSSANIHYHLGLAYLQDGKKAEAKAALQQVLKLNPEFPDAAEVRRVLASIEG